MPMKTSTGKCRNHLGGPPPCNSGYKGEHGLFEGPLVFLLYHQYRVGGALKESWKQCLGMAATLKLVNTQYNSL